MDSKKAASRGSLLELKALLSADEVKETAIVAYIYGYRKGVFRFD